VTVYHYVDVQLTTIQDGARFNSDEIHTRRYQSIVVGKSRLTFAYSGSSHIYATELLLVVKIEMYDSATYAVTDSWPPRHSDLFSLVKH